MVGVNRTCWRQISRSETGNVLEVYCTEDEAIQ